MLSRKAQVSKLITDFADAISLYNKDGNMLTVDQAFITIENNIHRLPQSYQEKLIVLTAQLKQFRALCNAKHASYLYREGTHPPFTVSYKKIRTHIKRCTSLLDESQHNIEDIQSTIDFLPYMVVDEQSGGINIDFGGSFSLKCIDFEILKYNLHQNYACVLASILPSIPMDIYPKQVSNVRLAVHHLRKALHILRDFTHMTRGYNNSEDKENANASFKLNKRRPRIPRTFFGESGTIDKMDSVTNGVGFIQFVMDLKCKTYFELSNAYCLLRDTNAADTVYTEGINALLNRSNHGQYVETTPPHSWYQLIQSAIRFYTHQHHMHGTEKHERARSIIHNVLTFYQNPQHDVDIGLSTDLLLERSRLLMYREEHHGAILANEQIKHLRGNENNEEKAMVAMANSNIFVINSILRIKNELTDTVNFLQIKDDSASVYEWIRRINTDIVKVVFYCTYWNIDDDEKANCPAPIEVVYDMMAFVFGCIGFELNEHQSFEKQLKQMDVTRLLQLIEEWNGTSPENENAHDLDLKTMALRMEKRNAKILIDFLLFGAMAYTHSTPPRYRNAAKLLEKVTRLAQYTKCKQREALLYFKLGECNKALERYPVAIGNLSKAAEIAEKIEHIHMARDIRLTQIEIYDANGNHKSKRDVIELHLETKYNVNEAMRFMDQNGCYYIIKCKYDDDAKAEEDASRRKIELVLPLDADDDDLDTDSDDDITIVATKPKPKAKAVYVKRKKSRFEESSDDEDNDCAIIGFADTSNSSLRSNSRKRKAESSPLDAMYGATKRRKLNHNEAPAAAEDASDDVSDTEGTITDLQSMNAPIMDLCSGSEEEEEKEREFDEIIESQNSEEMDELDHEAVNLYYHGGFQDTIDTAKHELQRLMRDQIASDDASSIHHIIKMCDKKILIADTWMEKANYIKDNEPKTIQTYKLRRNCHKEAISYAKDIPIDCAPFIQRHIVRGPCTAAYRINAHHSRLMCIYLASLELFGKYLISKKDWNEAIRKYDEYLKHKLVDYTTVDSSIILHWKYFCASNIAYCYRQRAAAAPHSDNDRIYKDRCKSRDYYLKSKSILHQLLTESDRIANHKLLSQHVLNAKEIHRQLAYTNIELGHTFDELSSWRNAIQCYEKAAQISSAEWVEREHMDQQLDAYFNLARTLHDIKDYRRALYIFQTDCMRCVKRCLELFGSTEFRMIEFDIKRWITDILLQTKQMKSAKDSAQKLQYIARHYLSKHTKYSKEAAKYMRACQVKSKYQSAIHQFEEKRNQRGGRASHAARYRCLRRLFELKSYGTIVENKNQYLDLMERIQNADSALYIRYMIACAFKERERSNYSQSLLMPVFDDPQSIQRVSKRLRHKLIPKCAYSLAQSLTHSLQAIRILLVGFEYITETTDRNFRIEYLQRLLLLYDTYPTKSDLQHASDYKKIKEARNQLKCVMNQRSNHPSRGPRNRYRRSRHSYSHRNQYRNSSTSKHQHNTNNNYNNNNNNHNKERRSRRMNHKKTYVSSSHLRTYRSPIAQRMNGLNERSQSCDLKQAIQTLNDILAKCYDTRVVMELMTIRERYQQYLSRAPSRSISTAPPPQQQRTTHSITNIRNNPVGIVHEPFHWIYAPSTATTVNTNWRQFNENEAEQIESEYCKESKLYRCRSYYIQFTHLGNYKIKTDICNNGRTRTKALVQRRVQLNCLHPRKIKGWTALCNRKKTANHRCALSKESNATEYNAICLLLKMRGLSGGLQVHKIERIQNITTQMRYNLYHSDGNEFLLFHGTKPGNVSAIIEEGTDFRLYGSNGTKYGDGSYFAVYASYAAQFANESQVDASIGRMVRYMFLCAVKAGDYCLGTKGLKRPPKRTHGSLYNSVVDNVQHPSIFVTFDNAMSLPLYLISFSFDA